MCTSGRKRLKGFQTLGFFLIGCILFEKKIKKAQSSFFEIFGVNLNPLGKFDENTSFFNFIKTLLDYS